jgi:hypothetical protein
LFGAQWAIVYCEALAALARANIKNCPIPAQVSPQLALPGCIHTLRFLNGCHSLESRKLDFNTAPDISECRTSQRKLGRPKLLWVSVR